MRATRSDARAARSRAPRLFAAAGVAAGAAWALRHTTARAVRAWRPGTGRFQRVGDLTVRLAGSGGRVFVLLHGLVASSDTFGRAYDKLEGRGRLLVPDLLGFARSMVFEPRDFSLPAHLEALDQLLDALGLSAQRLVIVGHSLGGVLALHWAARRRDQVERVITFGAPLFRTEEEAHERWKAMGMLESLFAEDSSFAEKACELMCRFRSTAAALAIAVSPDLPVALSRRAVQHTWPAYRGAMSIFLEDWETALQQLVEAGVAVKLIAGSEDHSQVPGLAHRLALRSAHVASVLIPNATHILPITHGDLCVDEIIMSRESGSPSTGRSQRSP